MTKRGAPTSKSEHERERSRHAPASSANLTPVARSTRRSEPPSLAEEASLLSRDEREAQLMTQFFSWPPPPSAPFVAPHFERAPLSRESRRAMWASIVMLVGSVGGIGGFAAYQSFVMPQPLELGEWTNSDSVLEPSGMGEVVREAAPPLTERAVRNVYSASLQEPGTDAEGSAQRAAALDEAEAPDEPSSPAPVERIGPAAPASPTAPAVEAQAPARP